jgi:hypothetical protein
MGVDIKIIYKLKGDNHWTTLKLAPEQYFDPDLEEGELEGEEYEVDSVPRFPDVRDYLKEPYENITNINVFLKDIEKNGEMNFYFTYWNNGKNLLTETKSTISSKSYHEIIISLTINQYVYDVLRFLEENGTMRPIVHTHNFESPDEAKSDYILEYQGKGYNDPRK